MYIISVDNQDWLVGDSKGWLTTTPLYSMAAVYTTLLDAQEALVYYASNYANVTFTICPLINLNQVQSYACDENFSHDLSDSLSDTLMQRN